MEYFERPVSYYRLLFYLRPAPDLADSAVAVNVALKGNPFKVTLPLFGGDSS
jgi:hypothetical protein